MQTRGFAEPSGRVKSLKEMIMNAKPEIETDRAILITESYKETECLPAVLRRAKALENILLNIPVAIRSGELIVGAMTKKVRSVQIYPEFSCEWVEKEFETLGTRQADPFIISETAVSQLHDVFAYWQGKTVSDLALSYMSPAASQCVDDGIYATGNYLYGGIGHINADYGRVLKEGCRSIIERARSEMNDLDLTQPQNIAKQQFYEAVIISYEAVIKFAHRYGKEARRMAAAQSDSRRREELLQIAENCSRVPEYGAGSFAEAVQSFWFIHMIIQLESNGHSVSPGRFDQYMYPYFEQDTSLDKEYAQELIDCLWVKFNDINKIRDDRFAQAFAGYQAFQNLCVGGQDADGFDATNELSYLCMNAAARVKMPSPSFSIRVWQGTPDEFLLRACEVVRLGLGIPAMYNDEVIIPALINRGVTMTDARNYCLIGCVEPSIPGKTEGWHDSAFFNIAKVVELTLDSGKIGERQVGPQTKDITQMQDIEEFYTAYRQQMEYFVRLLVEANNSTDYAHTERAQLPYLSALVDDCLGRGQSLQDGGAIYNFTGPQAIGVADAGDSVYAIEKHVFQDKTLTMAELKAALRTNFGLTGEASSSPASGPKTQAVRKEDVFRGMSEEKIYRSIKEIISREGSVDLARLQQELGQENPPAEAPPVRTAAPGASASGTAAAPAAQGRFGEVQKLLENTPAYGNDIDEVDLAARRCGKIYCNEVEKYHNPRRGLFHAGMYPVSSNVLFGKDVGALPDGRYAGKPLADGVSPRAGKDVNGPTAAANSVAKLDHMQASNGTLYNQKFLPTAVADDGGLIKFSSVIRSYFDQKGMHVQFNVVDRETLYAAQRSPDEYKDLIVRVAGYSAQFIVLNKEVQDDIINRTEHGFS